MNELMWALYWIDVLAELRTNIAGSGLLTALVCIGATVIYGAAEQRLIPKKWWLFIAVVVMLPAILLSFIPSKQTMYVMLGVKTTANVMESDTGKKLQKIVDQQLDDLINTYTSKKEKTK